MSEFESFLVGAVIFAAIAAAFRAQARALLDATRLPAACYERPSFVAAALIDWQRNLVLLAMAMPIAAASLGLMRLGLASSWLGWWAPGWVVGVRTGLGWETFEGGGLLRILMTAVVAGPAWAYALQARNQFFDRAHALDRVLLLGSVIGVWLHPGFILPGLVLTLWSIHQLLHPRCFSYAWTQVRLPLDLMTAFVVCLQARIVFGIGTGLILTVLLTVFAASYFIPGVCKAGVGPFPLSWLVRNRLSNLFVSATNYGYLAGVLGARARREEAVVGIARLLRRVDVPLGVLTLAVELGAVALLADRQAAIVILALCIALHAGIALASGIVFWKWCIPSAAMIWVLAGLSTPAANHVFTIEHLALSLIAAGLSPWWLRPVELAWEDTGLNSLFRIEAVGRSGAVYEVGRNFMAPYDIFFCQSRLFFLTDRPALLGTLGAQTRRGPEFRDLATEIDLTAGDEAALASLRARSGRIARDDGQSRAFDEFLRRFFVAVNAGRPMRGLPGVPSAPPHMLFGTVGPAFARQEPVRSVRVRHIETFLTGRRIITLHDAIVREVSIVQDAAADAAPIAVIGPPPARRIAAARAG